MAGTADTIAILEPPPMDAAGALVVHTLMGRFRAAAAAATSLVVASLID
jgi:hypothetical protein